MLRICLITLIAATLMPNPTSADVGDTGSDWTLSTPDDLSVNLNDEVGKQATVLFFWASWCPYCKALMPHLQSMQFEYGDNLKVLAINIFEDGDPVAVIEEAGYDFTLLLDGDVEAGEYGITGTPGVIILDRSRAIKFDLRMLARIEAGASANATSHRQKAAFKAPFWAAEIRKSLDDLIATDYMPVQP